MFGGQIQLQHCLKLFLRVRKATDHALLATIRPMSLLGTIEHLAGAIGPRGGATSEENNAADWVAAELSAMGYTPVRQTFVSATSTFWPYIFAAGAVLLSLFFFWQPQPVGAGAALVLTGVALASLFLHVRLRDNLLRWLVPNDDSRNVIAKAPAAAPDKPPILVTANLDSPRATRAVSLPLLMLMMAGMGALMALFAFGILNPSALLRQIALIPGLVALILLVQMSLAQRAKFNAGANGNASGVAIALDLASRLAQQPPAHRDVIVAFMGCGEIYSAGLDAMIKAHGGALKGALHVAISHAGGPHPLALIRGEQFTTSVAGDAQLLALGERTAQACGTAVQTRIFKLGHGDLSAGVRNGLRSVGLMRLDSAGQPANWRAAGDTVGTLDEASLQQAADFTWHFIQAIDSEA